MDRLAGKHALITGGTSGIGLETARAFLTEGATVAITGRSQEKLDEAARQLDGPLLTIASDAGDVPGQAALAARLREEWPKLDILMSNAADITHLPIEAWTEEAFDRLLATNLKSPFFLIRGLLPLFSQQSSVILVGSVSAYIGHENATVYGAAKAGLLSYTRGLTYELKDRGIRVNGLSPGPTITNAFAPLGPERQAALYEELRQTVPLHRLGTAAELAKAAVYLASDESAYTAGTVLRVDGASGSSRTRVRRQRILPRAKRWQKTCPYGDYRASAQEYVSSRPRIRPGQNRTLCFRNVCEIRTQADGAGAPFREIRLGDGLSDDRMQVFLRRTGLLEAGDPLRTDGRDRRGDAALAAVVRAALADESEVGRRVHHHATGGGRRRSCLRPGLRLPLRFGLFRQGGPETLPWRRQRPCAVTPHGAAGGDRPAPPDPQPTPSCA